MPLLFDSFTCDSDSAPSDRRNPEWIGQLTGKRTVHIGEMGSILVGDPNDALPLESKEMTWGMPSTWAEDKGIDPWIAAISFINPNVAPTARANHGLVPLTSAGGSRHGSGRIVTVAALWRAPLAEPGHYGFCLLATEHHLLVVPPEQRATWMDTWSTSGGAPWETWQVAR